MVKDAEDKFNNEQLRQARELVEAARTDPLKRKQLAGAVRQFDPGLAGQIEAAGTPEGKPSAYQQDQSRLAQKQTDDSREGLAEEREKRLKERNEQVKAERKEREKQVEEYSKDLQGAIGRDIIGNVTGGAGAMDPDRLRGRETRKIRDRLRQSGVADEDAEDLAPDVYDKVFKATVAQIKKKAMGDPAGKMDDLGAARALRDEDAEKARREKEQRAGRLQKDAAELLPGLDALSRSEIGRRIGAGQSDEAAQAGAAKAIEAALVKAGMKPGDARTAATEEAADVGGKMRGELVQMNLKGDQENRRNSEIVDAANLGSKIQASIGAADPQLQQMKEIAKILGLQYRAMEEQAKRPQVAVLGR
jgi:hypothetical protein